MHGTIEHHQPLKLFQQSQGTSSLGLENLVYYLANPVLIEHAIDDAQAEELPGLTSNLCGFLHAGPVAPAYALSCFAVSSARRRWSSGVRILPVTAAVVCTTS